jgi:hypothetical protein
MNEAQLNNTVKLLKQNMIGKPPKEVEKLKQRINVHKARFKAESCGASSSSFVPMPKGHKPKPKAKPQETKMARNTGQFCMDEAVVLQRTADGRISNTDLTFKFQYDGAGSIVSMSYTRSDKVTRVLFSDRMHHFVNQASDRGRAFGLNKASKFELTLQSPDEAFSFRKASFYGSCSVGKTHKVYDVSNIDPDAEGEQEVDVVIRPGNTGVGDIHAWLKFTMPTSTTKEVKKWITSSGRSYETRGESPGPSEVGKSSKSLAHLPSMPTSIASPAGDGHERRSSVA